MNTDVKSTAAELEPTSVVSPLPVWLLVGTLLLLLWGAVFFDRNGALMDAKIYRPYRTPTELERFQVVTSGPDAILKRGKLLYEQNCALCHNVDGSGRPGQGPPFVSSEWVKAKGFNRIIRIPQVGVTGPIKVAGQEYNMNMGNMGAPYNDQQLSDVLSYIRFTFGKNEVLVTPEQVKKVRADIGTRTSFYTADELLKLEE
jgi:mono/diheme cytochrome c family protein